MSEKEEVKNRIGCVVVTHGQVATEVVAAAETIVGELPHVAAVSIGWHDDVDAAQKEIAQAIKRVGDGRGVLILTDMFGGTPTNISSMFLEPDAIEIITGVNLPMLIKFSQQRADDTLTSVAARIRDAGKEGIHLAGEMLKPRHK